MCVQSTPLDADVGTPDRYVRSGRESDRIRRQIGRHKLLDLVAESPEAERAQQVAVMRYMRALRADALVRLEHGAVAAPVLNDGADRQSLDRHL
jgi:hypothetical protein